MWYKLHAVTRSCFRYKKIPNVFEIQRYGELWFSSSGSQYICYFLYHEQLIWKSYIRAFHMKFQLNKSSNTNMERTSLAACIHTSFFQLPQPSLLQLCVPHEAWPSQNMASSCSSDYPSTQKETNNMMRCAMTKFQLHPSQGKESTMLHNFGHLEAVLKMVAYSQCVLLTPNLF